MQSDNFCVFFFKSSFFTSSRVVTFFFVNFDLKILFNYFEIQTHYVFIYTKKKKKKINIRPDSFFIFITNVVVNSNNIFLKNFDIV